jgi:hypothetical protein
VTLSTFIFISIFVFAWVYNFQSKRKLDYREAEAKKIAIRNAWQKEENDRLDLKAKELAELAEIENQAREEFLLEEIHLVTEIRLKTNESERLRASYLEEQKIEENEKKKKFKEACRIGGVIYLCNDLFVMTDSSPQAKISKGAELEIIEQIAEGGRNGFKVRYKDFEIRYGQKVDVSGEFFISHNDLSLEKFSSSDETESIDKSPIESRIKVLDKEISQISKKLEEMKSNEKKRIADIELQRKNQKSKEENRWPYSQTNYTDFTIESDGNNWKGASDHDKQKILSGLSSNSRHGNSAAFFEDALDEFYSDPELRNVPLEEITRMIEAASTVLPPSERDY